MKKFGKNKIALFLTCMSVFGSRASAMNTNNAQNPQTVAAVGGAVSRNNQSVKQGFSESQKLAIGVLGGLGITLIVLATLGVKKLLDNKNKDIENTTSCKKGYDKKRYDYIEFDYVEEINKFLSKKNEVSMKETFNKAVNVIKNNKFNDEETKQLAEFLKVIKGEKKVLSKKNYIPFGIRDDLVLLYLDDDVLYGLSFYKNYFGITKVVNENVIYNLELNYN